MGGGIGGKECKYLINKNCPTINVKKQYVFSSQYTDVDLRRIDIFMNKWCRNKKNYEACEQYKHLKEYEELEEDNKNLEKELSNISMLRPDLVPHKSYESTERLREKGLIKKVDLNKN